MGFNSSDLSFMIAILDTGLLALTPAGLTIPLNTPSLSGRTLRRSPFDRLLAMTVGRERTDVSASTST